jgi:hypothetical protein
MPNPDGKAGVVWNMTVESTDPLCTSTILPTSHELDLTHPRVLLQTTKRYPLR